MKIKLRAVKELASVYLACLIFLPTSLAAETIKDVIVVAFSENVDLQAAKLSLKKAESKLKQAGLWPNPELEFFRNFDEPFNNEGEFEATASFKQRFPLSGRISDAKDIARVDVAMALSEIRNHERLLVGEISGAARRLIVLDESIRVNEGLQGNLKDLIAVSEKKLKVAEISVADINLEKLELQKLAFSLASLQSERAEINELLVRLSGQAGGVIISISDPISIDPGTSTLIEARNSAVQRRPDRQLASLAIDKAASEVSLAKAERFEDWTVGFEYKQDRSRVDFGGDSGGQEEYIGVSISIPLPLWNQNEGKISEAKVESAIALKKLESLERQIESEARSAFLQLEKLSSPLSEYQGKSKNLANDNVKILRESYAQGLVGIASVIQAQQQLADTQQSYLSLLSDYYKALTNFETSTASSPYWERT